MGVTSVHSNTHFLASEVVKNKNRSPPSESLKIIFKCSVFSGKFLVFTLAFWPLSRACSFFFVVGMYIIYTVGLAWKVVNG